MNYKIIRILIFSVAISLIGILITQSIWLKKTVTIAEKQYDHRSDQMLQDIVDELKRYSDTAITHITSFSSKDICLFDVVDTILLEELVSKYCRYHNLDTIYSYGLVASSTNKILFSANNFASCQEPNAYKVCLSCIWHEEYIHLSVFFPNKEKHILGHQIFWIFLSIVFILITISAFGFIVFSIYKQKKISEIKNDFVNNMTHELKTPISTISVASEVLLKSACESENIRLKKYSKVIFDENLRMKKLVEKVLDIATLDRGALQIEKEELNLHDTINKIIENFCFEACDKNVNINYKLDAINPILFADKIHLRNILNNLVDNAVKYSDDEPNLIVSTESIKDFFKITVSDKGKGIPKDSLKKVFDKFYRVPSGNIHNVKGFGLGLYYVKTMVESHNGKIEIQSTLNKGTTVSVFLPQ